MRSRYSRNAATARHRVHVQVCQQRRHARMDYTMHAAAAVASRAGSPTLARRSCAMLHFAKSSTAFAVEHSRTNRVSHECIADSLALYHTYTHTHACTPFMPSFAVRSLTLRYSLRVVRPFLSAQWMCHKECASILWEEIRTSCRLTDKRSGKDLIQSAVKRLNCCCHWPDICRLHILL